MPIYEYVCKSCGGELEAWQKMSEKPLRKCPTCSALKLERIVSRTSFQLKGDGWYVTGGYGNKKNGADKPASKDGERSEKAASPPPAKSEKPCKKKGAAACSAC